MARRALAGRAPELAKAAACRLCRVSQLALEARLGLVVPEWRGAFDEQVGVVLGSSRLAVVEQKRAELAGQQLAVVVERSWQSV